MAFWESVKHCLILWHLAQKKHILNLVFQGKVIIIGAGAAGLTAGYHLMQQGIDFEILEASNTWGGRMKINTQFADFPIPLGAEWIETETGIFEKLVSNNAVDVNVQTIEDHPDKKFINYSWFNFFEDYIIPSIEHKIHFNTIVKKIDFSKDIISIATNNETFSADKTIVSVPLKILQVGDISFVPNLPLYKQKAIEETIIWDGFKAFFEFSFKFYEEEHIVDIKPKTDGEKIYYNASFGQNSNKNILGLFAVGKPALDYQSIPEQELKSFILRELDAIYDGQATPNYKNHIIQNWKNEPFIQSGYMTDHADWRVVKDLGQSVDNKLYFAGGAFTDGEDWVSVHAAALSGVRAVNEL